MSATLQTAIKATRAAQVRSTAQHEALTQLERSATSLGKEVSSLTQRVATAGATVAKLKEQAKANPAKYGPALKAAEAKLTEVSKTLSDKTKALALATKQLGEGKATLRSLHEEVFRKAKDADAIAEKEHVPLPFAEAYFTDSVLDASSLSPAQQRNLLGSPSTYTAKEAFAHDVNTLKDAARLGPENALHHLNHLLMGTAPANQAALLRTLLPELEAIASDVSRLDPATGQGNASLGEALLETIKTASPDARSVVLGAVAKHLRSTSDGALFRSGLVKALREHLKDGTRFGDAAELIHQLERAGKPEAASELRLEAAEALRPLREDYEAKAEKAQKLRGELALLVEGFGPLLGDTERKAAIAAFERQHAAEFSDYKQAAAKLAGALPLMERHLDPAQGPQGRYAFQGTKLLDAELKALVKDLPSLQETPEGSKAIADALKESLNGPSWLDSAVNLTKNSKEGAETLAKVVASGIGQLAMVGEVTAKDNLVRLLSRHGRVLGLEPEKVGALRDAFIDATGSKESTAKLKKAFRDIEAGQFGGSTRAKTTLAVIGIGLSAYGFAKGVKEFGEADVVGRLKTVVDGGKLSVEAATLGLKALSREGVVKTLSKVSGGLNVVGGVLDLIGGATSIAKGDLGAGASDLLSGAGSIAMVVPGGQLVGAVLGAAGLVTKLVVNGRAARKSEVAAQEDMETFLKAGGIPAPLAEALADVRQSDHGNAGQVIVAIAEKLGVPKEVFFKKLLALSPKQLGEFVDMALDVHARSDGTLPQTTKDIEDLPGGHYDSSVIKQVSVSEKGGTRHLEPRSVGTAAEWTRAHLAKNGVSLP